MYEGRPALRVHATNIVGAGATQLVQSLLPALERVPDVNIEEIYLPDRGGLAAYQTRSAHTRVHVYRRNLPNAVSRLLECTWLAGRFDSRTPLLVLGDLPLRCNAPQTVFVQTPHLIAESASDTAADHVRFATARWLFRRNAGRVRAFIVQTSVMEAALVKEYPTLAGRVHVIAQPVPRWLLDAGIARFGRKWPTSAPLALVYPAAQYPHKNHRLLGEIDASESWPVARLTLTVAPERSPAPTLGWLRCVGFLQPNGMLDLYREADALLFLSTDESYGFPLVEAMFVGLPIVCPDLPYARTLCGDDAIYFDAMSIESLKAAVTALHDRLSAGWWPDWTSQLASLPADWDAVAQSMARIALGSAC